MLGKQFTLGTLLINIYMSFFINLLNLIDFIEFKRLLYFFFIFAFFYYIPWKGIIFIIRQNTRLKINNIRLIDFKTKN